MRLLVITYLLLILGNWLNAQTGETDKIFVKKEKIGSETEALPSVQLQEVNIISQRTFKDRIAEAKYLSLKRKIIKVYPYARAAADILNEVDSELERIDRRRKERKYLKSKEEALREAFEGELRNLTRSEGEILFKLISRETGKSTYHIIRELKSPVSALWWQLVALKWNYDLREVYDPLKYPDIESIVSQLESEEKNIKHSLP